MNQYNMPTCVLGTDKFSPSSLYRNKSKRELISLLRLAQENYSVLLEFYENSQNIVMKMYKEGMDKGIEFECLKGK